MLSNTPKQFYVIWLDEQDIPRGVLTGPFSSAEQATTAAYAISPLFHPTHRLCTIGGDLTYWYH